MEKEAKRKEKRERMRVVRGGRRGGGKEWVGLALAGETRTGQVSQSSCYYVRCLATRTLQRAENKKLKVTPGPVRAHCGRFDWVGIAFP